MSIEVYTFESADNTPFGSYSTQNISDAREYARKAKLRLIANTYTFEDSELIEDYTETDDDTDPEADESTG